MLIVHSIADLYGASRSLLRLASGIDRRRFDVTVMLPEWGPLVEALRVAGVRVVIQPSLSVITGHILRSWQLPLFLVRIPWSVLELARFIKRERIELVHSNVAPLVSSGAATALADVPHIWHIREFFHQFGWLWRFYRRYMLRCSRAVVCVSGPIAEQFERKANGARIVVLHNGIPLDEFAPVTSARIAAFRQQHALGRSRLVGIVGRIKFERKGQEVFVRAAALLAARYSDVKFVIIGSPFPGNEDHLVRLRRLIDELSLTEHVILTGDANDIKGAVSSLDVLTLCSSEPEPFAGVVLEAMALGVPVIATRTGGSIEQIEDGVSGLLVKPRDPVELAAAISRLLDDDGLHQSIRQAAFERVRQLFRFDEFAASLIQLYEDALAMGRRPAYKARSSMAP